MTKFMDRSTIVRWLAALPLCLVFACALDDGEASDDTGNAATDGNDDGASGAEGASGADGADGGVDGSVSIYDVRQGKVPEGTNVRLEDVVVTSPVKIDADGGSGALLIGEPDGGEFSGIYVYLFDEVAAAAAVEPGTVVHVTGEYTEFYGVSEITVRNVADLEIVGTGELPDPSVVAPADVATGGPLAENYESVIVRVENVEVTNADLGFGDFQVAGDLIVDDFFISVQPNPGTVFEALVGPLMFSFDEFRLAPRSDDDVVGGEDGIGAQTHTIYEIRQGMVAEDTRVRVEEVVVTSPPSFKGDTFFVQDRKGGAHSGIAAFLLDPEGLALQVGDVITLEGRYQEFYDLSEIVLSSAAEITRIDATFDVQPAVVAPADVGTGGSAQEDYEGVLVQVTDAQVTQPANDFGEFQVAGALQVDDYFFGMGASWPDPPLDTTYAAITGVMIYDFEVAKLAPRTLADFAE
jgi:DNA/RNA endonuclease YhcR with UshA esterase domain